MLTARGKVFADVIKDICWTKGWGTTGITKRFPDTKNKAELEWLVSNGYLFHFCKEETNHNRNWRYKTHMADYYGITQKGWTIAGNYVDAAAEEIEGYEIDYQFDHYPRRPNKKVGKD